MRSGRGVLTAILLATIVVALAVLQYRWIGNIADAERTRAHSRMHFAASGVADDFDQLLAQAFVAFEGRREMLTSSDDHAGVLVDLVSDYRRSAPFPDLIKQVYLFYVDGERLFRLDPRWRTLQGAPTSGGMERLLDRLDRERPPPRVGPGLPALVMALDEFSGAGLGQGPWAFLILELDLDVIRDEILAGMVERELVGLECRVAVTARNDPSDVIFSRGLVAGEADVEVFLFSLEQVQANRQAPGARGIGPGLGRPGQMGPRAEVPPRRLRVAPPEGGDEPAVARGVPRGAAWRLGVSHSTGSLDLMASRLRMRNLAVSAVILMLLVGSVVMTWVATQRADNLSRQQIELVAGVSHELKTPLAAIRSAGQNLADGVVVEPRKIKEYGALIEREERRLSRMVFELLDLAGMREGRRERYRMEPVRAQAVIAGAVEDNRTELESRDLVLEIEIEPELPDLMVDPVALRRACRNLIENAIKHGAGGECVTVRARSSSTRAGLRVVIEVVDKGPGISAGDRRHVFDPFYRGQGTTARASGSGLGLSIVKHIVEAHGGRVALKTGGGGTTVAMDLPIIELPDPEQETNNEQG